MNKNLLLLLLISISSNVFGSLARCTNNDDGSEFFLSMNLATPYFVILDKNSRQRFYNCSKRIDVSKPKDRFISFYNCGSVTTLTNSDNPEDTYANYSSRPTSFVMDTTKKNGKFKGSSMYLMWNYNSYEVNPSDEDTEKATCIRE